jgi:hypothetical protein
MEWEVFPHEEGSGDWAVEAINFAADGEIFTAIFSGPSAEERAREYVAWKAEAVTKARAQKASYGSQLQFHIRGL